jgi:hypothetical protein
MKKLETKNFYEMQNFNNFSQKKIFLMFSKILNSKLKGILLNYKLLMI